MPIENGKGDARQTARSAICRALGAARGWGARGREAGKTNGPERQAWPACSGTRWQGTRGDVREWLERLAERERAREPVSFSGLLRTQAYFEELNRGDATVCASFDIPSEVDARIAEAR